MKVHSFQMGKELLKNERRTKTNTYLKQFSGPEEMTESVKCLHTRVRIELISPTPM